MTSKKIKIVVADSRELFSKGLAALLSTKQELEIVGEVSNGRELLECLKQKDVHLVLLETALPVMDGKAILDIIQRRFPEIRVIVLSDQLNAQMQSDYMAHGANGFLSKECGVETLFNAIEKVRTEGFFFDSSTSRALLHSVLKDKQKTALASEISFNEREMEVIRKICDGLTNKEIATNMHLSASTIDFYRTKIYGKTKCNNATGLLKYAIKNGLVQLT